MTIKIPKELRGFSYDRVLPVDVNSFDVDLLLPSVFFKVISGGGGRGRRANDPTRIRVYLDQLAAHPAVEGFSARDGRRVLDRLFRTSLAQIGRQGQSRKVEQIEGVISYSFLSFKPEFPDQKSRLRRVDSLIYRMMYDQMDGDEPLRNFFQDIFGEGVMIVGGAEPDGRYDGQTKLDTLTRLSLALLDGFATTGVRKTKEKPIREACPGIADQMARDLRRYLQAYRGRMPIGALTYNLKALINFELFIYSIKLFRAVSDLVDNSSVLPIAMRKYSQLSPPDLYLDFIGSATGLSREMAASCVRRDLEAVHRFIWANLTLRQLDHYVRRFRGDRRVGQLVSKAFADDEGGPAYLQALLCLLEDPMVALRVDAAAQQDEEAIRRENNTTDQVEDDDGQDQTLEEFDRIAANAGSDFERIVLLLVEGQRQTVAADMAKWYRAVGGLTKPHGILTGHLKSRQSWRYAPSNDLLAVLVQLAAVDIPKWDKENPAPRPVRLRDFLEWLEVRFGILVDRPPDGFGGAEYVAAAQDNLRAMLRRLRQMGVFRDLSDDFTVQRLTPPYVKVDEERQLA